MGAEAQAIATPARPAPYTSHSIETAAGRLHYLDYGSAGRPPMLCLHGGAANGHWFVNFGSYGQRAIAQRWADQLQPGAGRVVVSDVARDGGTLYRVRVVGLADRSAAEGVARKLESSHGLAKLWVGQE